MSMNVYPPGTRIAGRYEVASRPMMGGMGIVYVCFDHQKNRPVVLKTFRPEYLPDRATRDRFLREGTAWVELGKHTHIVRCYGVEHANNGLEVYLVLELIAKEQGNPDASLRSWLVPGHPLPMKTALLFALQIVRGMQHAVACISGFVHRDLKPENVLIGADKLPGWSANRLRVTDFGLAVILQANTSNTKNPVSSNFSVSGAQLTHGIVGTPLYMAPEQWTGGPVGVYTDVYALGCILYEMLTGQQAAVGNSIEVLQHVHCAGNLRSLPFNWSEDIRAFMTRCLALDPTVRYTDWETLDTDLTSVLASVTGDLIPSPLPTDALDQEERIAAGWSYNAIGLSYREIGKYNAAIKFFQDAIQTGQIENARDLQCVGLHSLNLVYLSLGDTQRAIEYGEQALVIVRELGNQRIEGGILGGLGNAYLNARNIQLAISYSEQSLAIARKYKDRRGEAMALGSLGLMSESAGNTRQAIGYYEQCMIIAREIGDQWTEGNVLTGLGVIYLKLDDMQRALKYFKQSLEIIRKIGDRAGESGALIGVAVAYTSLGDTRYAIECYEKVVEIGREINNRNTEGTALFNLALLHMQQGDRLQALSLARQATEVWKQVGNPNYQKAQQLVTQLTRR